MVEFYLLFFSNIVFFILGYLLGKNNNKHQQSSIYTPQHKSSNNIGSNSPIKIDDKIHVTAINTMDFKKNYNTLGVEIEKDENIKSSINKLKQLKK